MSEQNVTWSNELAICLEEYKMLRAEVVVTLTFKHQLINFTLIVTGALIAASNYATTSSKYGVVYLGGAFLFYALLWMQLRYSFTLLSIGKYLQNRLSPRTQNLIAKLDRREIQEHAFAWDSKYTRLVYRPVWMNPIEAARVLFPLIAAVVCYAVYISIVGFSGFSSVFWMLLNIGCFAYSIVIFVVLRRRRFND